MSTTTRPQCTAIDSLSGARCGRTAGHTDTKAHQDSYGTEFAYIRCTTDRCHLTEGHERHGSDHMRHDGTEFTTEATS